MSKKTKMIRETKDHLERIFDPKTNSYRYVNIVNHIMTNKSYKDQAAQTVLKETAKQYAAFLKAYKNGQIKSVEPDTNQVQEAVNEASE